MVESDNWRSDLLNDNNFEQVVPFSYETITFHLEKTNQDLDNLNPFSLLRAIWEITKAFKSLSSALAIGFSDITSKVNVWRDNFKNLYTSETTMNEVLAKEISLGIHKCNGDNNSKLGFKKGSPYANYVSSTRTLLRLSWFLDFMNNIIKISCEKEDKSFSDCIKLSYVIALGPHHPFLVRKGAQIGINFAPSKREKAMKAFFGNNNIC